MALTLTLGPFSQTRPSRRMASLSHCTISNSVTLPVPAVWRAQAAAHLLPAFGEDGVDGHLRDGVAGDLLLVQHRLKLADQVGGADDLLAQAAQELDGSGVDHGDVHDGVVGRVLHGDARARRTSMASRPAAAPASLSTGPWRRAACPAGPARCDAPACAARRWRERSSTSGG